jgi:alpha-1,3-glucan synthase
MHIAFTLMSAQILGAMATILARAFGPNKLGPGSVFPDLSTYTIGEGDNPFYQAWFFVALFCQIVICVGYFLFFRKEQLAKP